VCFLVTPRSPGIRHGAAAIPAVVVASVVSMALERGWRALALRPLDVVKLSVEVH
jgi:hypothetical protein